MTRCDMGKIDPRKVNHLVLSLSFSCIETMRRVRRRWTLRTVAEGRILDAFDRDRCWQRTIDDTSRVTSSP